MAIHQEPHDLVGKTIRIKSGPFATYDFRIEDWWDRIAGRSWKVCDGNPACLDYAIRAGFERLPIDDEVVYGKIGLIGKLVHVSQLGELVKAEGQ